MLNNSRLLRREVASCRGDSLSLSHFYLVVGRDLQKEKREATDRKIPEEAGGEGGILSTESELQIV